MSKKKIISVLVFLVIITIVLSIFFVKHVDNKTANLDAETLKAMTYKELTDEDSKINNCDYVQFSAFFTRDLDKDGYAERLNGTCKEISNTDTLYAELKVLSKGYLKDGKITLNAKNFIWTTSIVSDTVVKGNYIGDTSVINLQNEILSGSEKLFWGKISNKISNINDYSKVNSITLTGTYVDDFGVETPISKTVNLTVDWYGSVKAMMSIDTKTEYLDSLNINDSGEMTVSIFVSTVEKAEELILKDNIITIEAPEINGYSPIEVNTTSKVLKSEYDSNTRILTITKSSQVSKSGNIEEQLARGNGYNIEFKYPKAAYELMTGDAVAYEIPVTSTYTGYNNKNKEFSNPVTDASKGIATLIFKNPDGELYNCDINVGEYVYTNGYTVLKDKVLKTYNNELDNIESDYYNVEWKLYTSRLAKDDNSIEKAILKEQEIENVDKFLSSNGNFVKMEEYTANVGIYFSGLQMALGENGYVNVYDNDSNELIVTFTKENWNKYTKNNPYNYAEKIKHIRIETSELLPNAYIGIYHIKELDDRKIADNIPQEEFKEYEKIYSYLNVNVNFKNAQTDSLDKVNTAKYEETESSLEVKVSPEDITNQEVSKNYKIILSTQRKYFNQAKWRNAEFLVKLPSQILEAQINSINASIQDVQIIDYELYKELDSYYLKIVTANETPNDYTITIDCNLTPNPIEPTMTTDILVYSYNENCTNYEYNMQDVYDVNRNNNKIENVGYNTARLQIIAPSTIVTSETVTNYDDLNEESITFAPNIAKVTKTQRMARINVVINNFYSGTISDTKILGEVPYEGNKYIITEGDLGSQFTVQMADKGIIVPNDLKNIAKVYYTENENADKNLETIENGWTQTPSDFKKVKRYLIDLGDYKIKAKSEYIFYYDVYIPEGIEYYKVSYSNHAIYFSLDTVEGKIPTETEPNKVGIQILRRYKLNLIKNKVGTNTKVPGATYRLIERDEKGIICSRRMLTTNLNGEALVDNLNINRTYELKEIKSPLNYSLNKDEISFVVTENETGQLVVTVNSDATFAKDPLIEKLPGSKDIVNVVVEDEPKYELQITKQDKENNKPLKDVKFKILETSKEFKTNNDGILTINELALNTTYTLRELKADGYYLPTQDMKFKLIVNTQGNYELISEDDCFENVTIDNKLELPVVKVIVTNEKVPTYSVEILKIAENDDTDEGLQGAKYQIKSEDTR